MCVIVRVLFCPPPPPSLPVRGELRPRLPDESRQVCVGGLRRHGGRQGVQRRPEAQRQSGGRGQRTVLEQQVVFFPHFCLFNAFRRLQIGIHSVVSSASLPKVVAVRSDFANILQKHQSPHKISQFEMCYSYICEICQGFARETEGDIPSFTFLKK